MKYRIMRLLCMFDLPVETDSQKRAYRVFRKNLIKEGFTMIQYSIYVRVCPNREYVKRIEKRIQKYIPLEGNVRLLYVTEKQYSNMKLLVGSRTTAEKAIGTERLILI